MKRVLVVIAAVLAWMLVLWPIVNTYAQTPTTPTRVRDSQVAAPPSQFTALWVVTPQGKVLVQPDASIQIDLLANPPTIKAVLPTARQEWVDQYVVPAGGQVLFSLTAAPVAGSLVKVYRNGVLQWQGVDYSLTGAAVLFLPGQGTGPGDLIQVFYWKT